jgi:hypothetical protein
MSSKRRLRRVSCEGKVKHKTMESAFICRKKILQKLPDHPPINIYRCQFCHQYHIGRAKHKPNFI